MSKKVKMSMSLYRINYISEKDTRLTCYENETYFNFKHGGNFSVKNVPIDESSWLDYSRLHQRIVRQAKIRHDVLTIVLDTDCEQIVESKYVLDTIKWLNRNLDKWDVFVGSTYGINKKQVSMTGRKIRRIGDIRGKGYVVTVPLVSSTGFVIYNVQTMFDIIHNWKEEDKKIERYINEQKNIRICTAVPFMYIKQGSLFKNSNINEYNSTTEFISRRIRINVPKIPVSDKIKSDTFSIANLAPFQQDEEKKEEPSEELRADVGKLDNKFTVADNPVAAKKIIIVTRKKSSS